MYALRSDIIPSFALILMGFIDCITTVIGVLYFGAAELNPVMTGIVNSSIIAFLAVKVSATLLIAGTYVLAKRTLDKASNKECKSFKYSNKVMKLAYAGLMAFLIIVVLNNFIVLLA